MKYLLIAIGNILYYLVWLMVFAIIFLWCLNSRSAKKSTSSFGAGFIYILSYIYKSEFVRTLIIAVGITCTTFIIGFIITHIIK